MFEEKDPILYMAPNQPKGTITLWILVWRTTWSDDVKRKGLKEWVGERRIIQLGSADHLRYSARAALREYELQKEARKNESIKSS